MHEEVFIKGSWEKKKNGCERIEGEQKHTEMLFKAPQGKEKKDFGRQVTSLRGCASTYVSVCVCEVYVTHEEGLIWRFSATNRAFKLMIDTAMRAWHHS